jgi:hypothetical protein
MATILLMLLCCKKFISGFSKIAMIVAYTSGMIMPCPMYIVKINASVLIDMRATCA